MRNKIIAGAVGLLMGLNYSPETLEQKTRDNNNQISIENIITQNDVFEDVISGSDPNKNRFQNEYNSLKKEVDNLYKNMQNGSSTAKIISNYIMDGYYTHSTNNNRENLDIESKRFRLTIKDEKALRSYFLMTHLEEIVNGRNIDIESNMRSTFGSFRYKVIGVNLNNNEYGFGVIFSGRYKEKNADELTFKLYLNKDEMNDLNNLSRLTKDMKYKEFLLSRNL